MARTVNESELELKRRFIIEESIKLITEVGYKAFSVNQVIKRCGISKGSFFHHFENKEALIEGITDRLSSAILTDYDHVMEDKSLSARQQVRALFDIGYQIKIEGDFPLEEFVKILYQPENQELYKKLMEKGMTEFISYLERIIVMGSTSGEFKIKHPKGMTRHFVRIVVEMNQNLGRVLYIEKPSLSELEALQDELLAFEEITQLLFGFEEDHQIYGGVHKLVEMKLEGAHE
jgi:AcrR family transcriptional regulator